MIRSGTAASSEIASSGSTSVMGLSMAQAPPPSTVGGWACPPIISAGRDAARLRGGARRADVPRRVQSAGSGPGR